MLYLLYAGFFPLAVSPKLFHPPPYKLRMLGGCGLSNKLNNSCKSQYCIWVQLMLRCEASLAAMSFGTEIIRPNVRLT